MTDIITAFAVAVLSGLGVGGGGLFVIYLTLIKGIPQLEAQGINLIFFICGCVSSLFVHIKKRKISFLPALILVVSGIFGVFLGTYTANKVPSDTLKSIFGIMLIITGFIALFKKEEKNKKSIDKNKPV